MGGDRSRASSAIAVTVPPWICGSAPGVFEHMYCIWPPIMSAITGPTALGNVWDIDAGGRIEQRAGKVRRRTHPAEP
jgi:hypothetical protein